MSKVKIAVVGIRGIPATYGGIEKHCEMLYPIMAKAGFDITVYARAYYNEHNITEFRGVKIKSIPVPDISGFETFIHSFTATIYATFSDADIIHFHAQGPALFSFIPRIFAPGKKICFTCHGIDKDRDKWGKLGKFVLTLGEIASAKIPHYRIGVSESLSTYYKNKYNVKMHTIYNGVSIEDPMELKNTTKFNIKKNSYFMFAGRLVPEKAPDILIKAFKKTKTDKKLLIVGDSAGTDDYVKSLKELASGDERIIFTSYVYGDDLKELYSNAFSYISASKLEGLPLTVLEAMSFALPVVLSDIKPHTEIINSEYNTDNPLEVNDIDPFKQAIEHILSSSEKIINQNYNIGNSFETNNVNSCKQAIENILSLSENGIIEMKKSSKQLAKDAFDWTKVADQTIKLLSTDFNK